jgi:RNA polymerase sigma-70 factor (ECF subfamily)
MWRNTGTSDNSRFFSWGKDRFSATEQLEEYCVHSLGRQAPNEPEIIPPKGDDDAALVAAVLRKDRKATAEFVARYADSVYGYVRARLAPRQDQIEDLVQDVFLSAWESLGRYRGDGSLRAWVMGIARHKVEDYYRGRLVAPESLDESDPGLPLPASIPEADRLLEQAQLQQKTRQVLAELPEPYRLALIWRYWEKASARDMAVKTGKTEKAIERLLARARAEFRERWNHGQ